MTYDEISAMVVDESDTLVYIADPATYELLYLNPATSKLLGNPPANKWKNQPCFQVLQGKSAPCAYCTNAHLTYEQFYVWDHYNEMLNQYFTIKDKLVNLNGRTVRLELAINITDKELKKQWLEEKLLAEKTIIACLERLNKVPDVNDAIDDLLSIIGTYYQSDRAYIFEIHYDRNIVRNSYEWCKENISPQIDNLQNAPLEGISRWMEEFQKSGEFYLTSLGKTVDHTTLEYQVLASQGVESLMAAPLWSKEKIIGFLGVDNPNRNTHLMTPLRSVAAFIGSDIIQRNLLSKLTMLSYTDELTNLNNRHSYTQLLNRLSTVPPRSLGILYGDINGLKAANDTYGHRYGDRLIQEAAQLLRTIFETNIYRVGGDEFVVVCENMSKHTFEHKILQLRQLNEKSTTLKLAIGFSWRCADSIHISKQIAQADDLLYADKQSYYDAQLSVSNSHLFHLSRKLLSQIANGDFLVYLKAKFHRQNQSLVGAQAILQRKNTDGTLLPLSRFSVQYENEGIIRHLDFFVMTTVCAFLQQWNLQTEQALLIAVSLSPMTLLEPNVTDKLLHICTQHHINPKQILIEVTENLSMIETNELLTLMTSLQEAGFGFSLDDFTEKYTKLSALASLTPENHDVDSTDFVHSPIPQESAYGFDSPLSIHSFMQQYAHRA